MILDDRLKVLVTAGATYEPIDPVRFIGNRSTGKMGICLVEELLKKNTKVFLILGVHSVSIPEHPNLEVFPVETAEEMLKICLEIFPKVDVLLQVAAVSDYRVAKISEQKIKKTEQENLTLELVKNPDILKILSHQKTHQKIIGFALETENELFYAKKKIENKDLDAIVLNSLAQTGAGFGVATNAVHFLTKQGFSENLTLNSKEKIAEQLVNLFEKHVF